MRQSIGGVWLFTLIITFTLLFSGFLVVTLNYARAYRVKNEVLSFLEREEGFTSRHDSSAEDHGAVQLINDYLENVGYNETGRCPDVSSENWRGIRDIRSDLEPEIIQSGVEYYYCIRKINNYNVSNSEKAYYDVRLFFNFNLPVFGDLFDFGVDGMTAQIEYPADCTTWQACKDNVN